MNRREYLRAVVLAGGASATGCIDALDAGRRGKPPTTPEPTSRTSTPTATARDRETPEGTDASASEATDTPDPTTPAPPAARSGTTLSGVAVRAQPGLDDWLGHTPAVMEVYVDALTEPSYIEAFVRDRLASVWRRGHVPMLTWQPIDTTRPTTPADVEARIADGAFDHTIRAWARRLSSWVFPRGPNRRGRRLYFRPAPEMNGDWNPWSAADADTGEKATQRTGTPAEYVEMWQRIHGIFSETPMDGTNIQWVWSPNAGEVGGVKTERYYPGTEYVDWIGLDGFNDGDTEPSSRWRTPEEVFGAMVKRMRAVDDKPLALAEVASTSHADGAFDPARKAAWIERLFSFVEDRDIRMVCWFNADGTGAWESDWAVFGGAHGTATHRTNGSTYAVYDAYKRAVGDPSMLHARPDYPPILTDDEFAGRP